MKRLLVAAALFAALFTTAAHADCNGIPSANYICGSPNGSAGPMNPRAMVGADLPASVYGTQAANKVYAGPASGGAVAPAFRSLVPADVPTLPLSIGGLGGSQAAATANQIPVFPGSGGAAVPTTVGGAGGFFDTICSSSIGQAWVRLSNGWGCSALGWFNPVWWGADPTGSADSTSAINSAISAAGGGKVLFPPGIFKVSSAISLATVGLQIEGSGRLSTVIRTTQTAANVFVIGGSYQRIAHMAVVGNIGTVATAGAAIYGNGNYGGGSLEDLYISDLFQGISFSGLTGWKISFIKMLDIYSSGLLMVGGGGHYVSDNQFDPLFWSTTTYSVTSGYGTWIASHAYSAGQVVIVNSGIFVCQTGGTSASSGSGPVVTGFGTLITDGTVQWYFLGASNSAGISISSTSNSNFIRNSDISGPWTAAVQINGSDGNIIDGVTIGQTIGTGVQLQASATDTVVTNSVFDGMLYTYGVGVSDNNGSAGGTRVTNNFFNGAGWYCILNQGSSNWIVADNTITGCGNITGASAIGFSAAMSHASIHDNIVISSAGIGIFVGPAASDYLNIHDNNVQSSSISYASTGTHNKVSNNSGYNPVGLTAGTSTGTSASTITAGPSPETHYITQSATFNAAVKSGTTTLCTVATATVPCVIDLGPNESYTVTWSTTQPTYSKYVH